MPQSQSTTTTPTRQDAEPIETAELIDRVRDFINSAECSTREQVGLDLVAMLGIAEAKLLSAPVTSPRVAALQLEKGLVASFHDGDRTDRLDITSALGVMAWLHDQANAQAGDPALDALEQRVDAIRGRLCTSTSDDDSDQSVAVGEAALAIRADTAQTRRIKAKAVLMCHCDNAADMAEAYRNSRAERLMLQLVQGLADDRSTINAPADYRAQVDALEAAIERALEALDALDGDCDLEDSHDQEAVCEDEGAVTGDDEPEGQGWPNPGTSHGVEWWKQPPAVALPAIDRLARKAQPIRARGVQP